MSNAFIVKIGNYALMIIYVIVLNVRRAYFLKYRKFRKSFILSSHFDELISEKLINIILSNKFSIFMLKNETFK